MSIPWKTYGASISLTKSTLKKTPCRSKRYKGIGRPKKTDYDYLTLPEVFERARNGFINQLKNNIQEAFWTKEKT